MRIIQRVVALHCIPRDLVLEGAVEWQAAAQHEVHDHADTEVIDSLVVLFGLEDLRSHEVGGAHVLFSLRQGLYRCLINCKSKIDQLYQLNHVLVFALAQLG